jgi:hypothetical protein
MAIIMHNGIKLHEPFKLIIFGLVQLIHTLTLMDGTLKLMVQASIVSRPSLRPRHVFSSVFSVSESSGSYIHIRKMKVSRLACHAIMFSVF